MEFTGLGLNPLLLRAIESAGYKTPTAIQSQAIPAILEGKDLMAGSHTGSGKTGAFILPVLEKLLCNPADEISPEKRLRTLILVPTRELAQQVQASACRYAQYTNLKAGLAYGGAAFKEQAEQLRAGVDILVATPGRLLDLLQKQVVNLNGIECLVFDEADRMLDMGFKDEIRAIVRQLPKTHQTLLFSATFDDGLFQFCQRILNKPVIIEVDPRNAAAPKVEQIIYNCDPDRKAALVSYLIRSKGWRQVLIFSRTKQGADLLAKQLQAEGVQAEAIHGDRSQSARENALRAFKAADVTVLVATDVAARGLDIDQLECVINYDMPYKAEDYVHRIGRTGRAGNTGCAVSLLIEEENYLLEEVEALLDKRLPQQWLTGFEPDLTREIKPSGRNSRSAQKRRAKARAFGKKSRR